MSFGAGSQSGTSTNVPKWALPYEKSLLPVATNFLNQSQLTENQAGGPAAQMTNYLKGVAGGNQLSPESNPYLQQTADVIKSNAQQNLNTSFANADRGAQGSGMLLSSANSRIKDQMARSAGQDVTNSLTNMYGQNYQAGLGRQMQAAGQLGAQDPYQKALQLASLFAGGNMGGSSSGSNMSMGLNII